jgi:hypothetical protein
VLGGDGGEAGDRQFIERGVWGYFLQRISILTVLYNHLQVLSFLPDSSIISSRTLIVTMGFAVLEPKAEGHVPGTVYLFDENQPEGSQDTSLLKHGTGKYAHIVLAPQPSDDPNDPLNWSKFEKHAVLAILGFGAIVCGATPVRAYPLPVSFYLHQTDPSCVGWHSTSGRLANLSVSGR